MIITSLNNPTIKEISKLKNKKYRDLTNTYLVEGEHLVEEAYKLIRNRRCGKVVCASCCKELILMKELGFDKPERVCSKCFKIETSKQQN